MRLELDLSPDDWADYKQALVADLKRVGVVTPTEPVGIAHFVRLGAVMDDGKPVVVMTPWLIWQAAHRALAEHLGQTPAPEPEYEGVVLGEDAAPAEQEPAPTPDLTPALAAIVEAMDAHARRWGLGPEHLDGTDPAAWREPAERSRAAATEAALLGELTWAHTFLEAADAAMATDDPAALRQALAVVAGTAAAWMEAIDGRADA